MDEEIWKDIEWYKWRYQVSNMWNVKSFVRNIRWKILKPCKDSNWYFFVRLSNWTSVKNHRVNRVVSLLFLNNLQEYPHVNHINWIKTDNRVDNLEWCTISQNLIHAYKNNLRNSKKKKVGQFTKDWEFVKEWWSAFDIKINMWIPTSNICNCCNHKKWVKSAWWFIWKYL